MTDPSREERNETSRRFAPDEQWIEAFQAQCTNEQRKKAKRFARSRARIVSAAGDQRQLDLPVDDN